MSHQPRPRGPKVQTRAGPISEADEASLPCIRGKEPPAQRGARAERLCLQTSGLALPGVLPSPPRTRLGSWGCGVGERPAGESPSPETRGSGPSLGSGGQAGGPGSNPVLSPHVRTWGGTSPLHPSLLFNPVPKHGEPRVHAWLVPLRAAVAPAHHAGLEHPPIGLRAGQRAPGIALRGDQALAPSPAAPPLRAAPSPAGPPGRRPRRR